MVLLIHVHFCQWRYISMEVANCNGREGMVFIDRNSSLNTFLLSDGLKSLSKVSNRYSHHAGMSNSWTVRVLTTTTALNPFCFHPLPLGLK